MGGPYNIPRNYKGEGKILMIFSIKAFIYTCAGIGIGLLFFFLFKILNVKYVGIIMIALFALIGYAIGTFKIPENKKFEFTKKTGGENIDTIILRWFKFKQKHNRIYVYKKGEK